MPQDGEDRASANTPDGGPSPAPAARSPHSPSEVSDDPLLRAAAAISDPAWSELAALAAGRPRTELVTGDVVAKRYRLNRELGRGGMGVVWDATHLITRRRVAIKFVLGPDHVHEDLRRRFYREARAASAANHLNVVEVLDVFELDDGTPVMVMELLSGETLRERLAREGRLSVEETAVVILPVVAALGAAHALGIVHRDLKPENVFLCRGVEPGVHVKVLDFGVAKLTGLDGLGGEASESESITRTGSALGTPCYMAPEQATGERDIDARADIWALGVIVYECLAAARPLEASGIGQMVMKLMTEGIKPLDEAARGLPPDVTALVMRMLARERGDRPQSLHEVQGILERHTMVTPAAVDTQSPQTVPSGVRRAQARPVVILSAGGVLAFAAFLGSRAVGPGPVASPASNPASVATNAPVPPVAPTPASRADPLAPPTLPAGAHTGTAQLAPDERGAARPVRVEPPRQVLPKNGPAAAVSSRSTPVPAAPLPRALDNGSAEPDPGGLADKPPF